MRTFVTSDFKDNWGKITINTQIQMEFLTKALFISNLATTINANKGSTEVAFPHADGTVFAARGENGAGRVPSKTPDITVIGLQALRFNVFLVPWERLC
jgi:hypothetical protein